MTATTTARPTTLRAAFTSTVEPFQLSLDMIHIFIAHLYNCQLKTLDIKDLFAIYEYPLEIL